MPADVAAAVAVCAFLTCRLPWIFNLLCPPPCALLQVVHALKRGQYHFFLTQTPFLSPLMFRLATQQNVTTREIEGAEKMAFAW
jgi:hypothetical protein